ncbi:MAG: hypothetical protein MIO92_01470 [Methanosarcinaceae archaeon]|nr:hypothetical protein [Methanosarcinaceae archaeon]
MKKSTSLRSSLSIFPLFGSNSLRGRQLIACFVVGLTVMCSAVNAQPVTPRERILKLSICEKLADQMNWLSPTDRATWVNVCKNGQVQLSNFTLRGTETPGSAIARVEIEAVGSLVDLSTLEVSFVSDQYFFPTSGTGIGVREERVHFPHCEEPILFKAVATWKTTPVGRPPSVRELSTEVTTKLQRHDYGVRISHIPYYGNDEYVSPAGVPHRFSVGVPDPGKTYTVTSINIICLDDQGLVDCQTQGCWTIVSESAPSLPAVINCGQALSFWLKAEREYSPVSILVTYKGDYGIDGFAWATVMAVPYEIGLCFNWLPLQR